MLEIGVQVGVFAYGNVCFGKVLDKEKKQKIAGNEIIKTEKYYFVSQGESGLGSWWHEKLVFPVWEGNYTHRDALELAEALRDFEFDYLANVIRGLQHMGAPYIPNIMRTLMFARDSLAEDIGEEMEPVKMIDRFLDWAAHGFPAGVA